MPSLDPSSLPFLGAGVGYRRAIAPFYKAHGDGVGFLEVMPEHLVHAGPQARRRLLQDTGPFPIVTHSVSLSVGSSEGPDADWLTLFKRANKALGLNGRKAAGRPAATSSTGVAWSSDHLCFTKAGEKNLGQLTPFPYTEEALQAVVRNVRQVQQALGVPFLLENISQYFAFKGADYDEPAFFEEVARKTGCGILLDVTNLGNNAVNLGWDPKRYLDAFPLERVVQLHLAGAERIDGKLLDTHGAPIHREVWRLAEDVVARCDVRALLIERDQTFGPMEQLAGELDRARGIMAKARGAA